MPRPYSLHLNLLFAGSAAVAFVALAGFGDGLGFGAAVGAKRAADVIAFLELTLAVAADEAFVAAGVDDLAFVGPATGRSWHKNAPSLLDRANIQTRGRRPRRARNFYPLSA